MIKAAFVVIQLPGTDRFAAINRAQAPFGWAIPGGGIEPGESPTQAACREVFEETGLELFIVCQLPSLRRDVCVFRGYPRHYPMNLRSSREGFASWARSELLIAGPYGQEFMFSTLFDDVRLDEQRHYG